MNINQFVELHRVAKQANGCWLWTKSVSQNGYGRVQLEGKSRKAHRVAYELVNGQIPDGHQVCHRCDTRTCVNPEHLFAGTQLDNMRDMIAKGRKVAPSGARHWAARLTDEQIAAIRQDTRSNRIIAAEYGIHKTYVNEIRRRVKRVA